MINTQLFKALLILLSVLLTSIPLMTFADNTVEGSALDSMEDLVSDLDEELSDDDLAHALAEEDQPATEEPEPVPKQQSDQAASEVKATTQAAANANAKNTADAVVAKPKAKTKPNALLILHTDQVAKVWINGRYRGRVTPKKAKPIPVRSGRIVITAKAQNGNARRLVKRMRPKSKVTATIKLGAKKRSKTRKNVKKRSKLIKGVKKTVKHNTVVRKTKKAVIGQKKRKKSRK